MSYFSSQTEDGTANYKSLGQIAVQVNVAPNGLVKAGNLKDCDGKTVGELRDAGRAFDYK